MRLNLSFLQRCLAIASPLGLSLAVGLLFAAPASAHHAMGGKLPDSVLTGFVTGLAHPVIGLDHFAFIVAVGLLASTKRQGLMLPIAFVLAALAGAGIHLIELVLPAAEWFISGSVLVFGILLAMHQRPSVWVLLGLGAIAGLFHGYAYAEAIFGAKSNPLLAYLVGFTLIQGSVAMVAFAAGKLAYRLKGAVDEGQSPLSLRFAGFSLCGAGAILLGTLVMESLFSLPGA